MQRRHDEQEAGPDVWCNTKPIAFCKSSLWDYKPKLKFGRLLRVALRWPSLSEAAQAQPPASISWSSALPCYQSNYQHGVCNLKTRWRRQSTDKSLCKSAWRTE